MKFFSLIFLFFSAFSYSQTYIFLDSLKQKFKVNEFTLNTKDIYGTDKEISLFNVYTSLTNILLLSVLPDLDLSSKIKITKSDQNWLPVNYDAIKSEILSAGKLVNILHEWESENTSDKKTFKYQLVKKVNHQYYVSKTCLTEQ